MRSARIFGSLVVILASACNKSNETTPAPKPSASWVSPSPLAAPSSSYASKSSASDAAAPPVFVESNFTAYQGTIGKDRTVLLGLERRGDELFALLVEGQGEAVALDGHMKDDGHFVLDEHAGKGRKGSQLEGAFDPDGKIALTLKDPKAKAPAKLTVAQHAPFATGTDTFEESYLGSLGNKLRVRVKWTRDKHLLTGVYRYTHSKSDLRLEGTVIASSGVFNVTEKNAKGDVTGRFAGVFLDPRHVLGRWYSADRARSLPLELRGGEAYPEALALLGGGKLTPQEDSGDRGKACKAQRIFPSFDGLPTKTAQASLNRALQSHNGPPSADDCDGATEDLPYEFESGYTVTGQKPGYVGLSLSGYTFTGGAHGMYGVECVVADLSKGTLTHLGTVLTTEGRAKLEGMVNDELRKQFSVTKLTDADFFDDEVKIAPATTMCLDVDAKGTTSLRVVFGLYEVTPYVMGMPEVVLPAAGVKDLFSVGSAGEAVFK